VVNDQKKSILSSCHRYLLTVIVSFSFNCLPSLHAQKVPLPLPDEQIFVYPFNMGGKVSSSLGEGSGTAIADKVVISVSHVFFDTETVDWLPGPFNWNLQHSPANRNAKMTARAYRSFSDYAKATRLFDPDKGNTSFEQINLDVISLLFFEDVANGGHAGWGSNLINSSILKMIVGYPDLGYGFFDPRLDTMHSTSLLGSAANFNLVNYNDRLNNTRRFYKTNDLTTGPGNSGGPVYGLITLPDGTTDWAVIGLVVGEVPNGQLFALGIDQAVSELIKTAESDTQSPTADDHGDSRDTATTILHNSTIVGNIGTASDLDYFRIEINKPGTLSAFTTGNTDTIGILQNGFGNIIAIDDESGAGRNRENAKPRFTTGNTNIFENSDSDEVRQNTLGNFSSLAADSVSGSNFLLSNQLNPGTYYILVSHYRDDGVGSYDFHLEFNETTLLPDLVVNSLNVVSNSVLAGEKLLVDFSRSNRGGEITGEFIHGLYFSADNNITTKDMNLINFTGVNLSAGSPEGNYYEVIIPEVTEPGTYYLGYIIDPFEQINEGDENNNTRYVEINVTDIKTIDNSQGQEDDILIKGWGNLVGESIIHHNGNVYNQVLLTGPFVRLRARTDEITRVAFLDENDDIVQVEFSGNAVVTITLDSNQLPLVTLPEKYNQNVMYAKGRPRVSVESADENTFLSIYTVGSINADNQALFPDGEIYDAMADVSLLEIRNSIGFGAIHCANTRFTGSSGKVGIDALGVPISIRALVGDIDASEDAVPYLRFGEESFTVDAPNAGLRITGGDLVQSNGASIIVAASGSDNPGFDTLITQSNFKSDGTLLPSRNIGLDVSFSNINGWKINVISESEGQ
jgi:hypothetical protein